MIIDDNAVVSMSYRLLNGDGEVIDSSQGQLPLVYMHNSNAILPSLERELTGKAKEDTVDDKENQEVEMMSVVELRDDSVLVDFNHPLAGQILNFQIVIVDVREPTEKELEQGFASTTKPLL